MQQSQKLSKWFDSKEIPPGGTLTWKADKPGTIKYHCDIHKGMEGVIIVQPGGAVANWADALFGQPANKIYVFDKNPPFKLVKVIEEGTQTLHPEFTADGKFVYIAD